MREERLNACDERRAENGQLRGVKCCEACHAPDPSTRRDTWVCCKIHHAENIYRPSAREISPLRS